MDEVATMLTLSIRQTAGEPHSVRGAINGNIRAILRRGLGYRDPEGLLLKVQKATAARHLLQTA